VIHAPAPTQPVWPAGVSLLLGLGAQKAGTTWLHDTLSKHPDCYAFPIKELHYFDTVSGVTHLGHVLTHKRIKARTVRGEADPSLTRVQRLADLLEAPDAAHQGYVDLVTDGVPAGGVALDITPAYAMLDDATFAQVAAMGQARFLFVMREPVARFWSGVRMMVNQRRGDAADFEPAARQIVDAVIAGESSPRVQAVMARGDYAATLDKLVRLVPENRRLVLFFETLFTQSTMDRIYAFLGVPTVPLTDTAPRLEGVGASLRPDQIAAVTEIFRPQYEAVCAAFGPAVPQAWHARFASASQAASGATTDLRRRLHR
jgi:hypothetical protein